MTILTLKPPAFPVSQDENGDLRVGGTRVLLDLVINAHKDGARPEEIVRRYDVLRLSDVYAAISYYLEHTNEIDAYMRQRDAEAEVLRCEIEANQPDRAELKAKLLARQARQTNHDRAEQ